MRTCFIVKVSRVAIAIADLFRPEPNERPELYELCRVNVPPSVQGKGYGSQLLKLVLAEADACGVTIKLYPFASGPLDKAALIAWYERYGFVKSKGIFWYRLPQKM